MKRITLLFLAIALLYVGAGFLPGRTFAPIDLLRDFDAWKDDPTERVRVSNSALSDVVVQFIAWDIESTRLLRAGEMPWTNRFAGDGAPLFANPQTAFFSPFTWPRLLFGLDGWANAGTIYGLRDVQSYDVLASAERVAALREAGVDDRTHSLSPTLSAAESERLAALGVRWVLSGDAVAGARRLEGAASPSVGVYELANAAVPPAPANLPPTGFTFGLVVALLSAAGCWFWVRSLRGAVSSPDQQA